MARRTLLASTTHWALVAVAMGLPGCESRSWSLGENLDGGAVLGFSSITLLAELSGEESNQDDPSLTADGLEMFFCSRRDDLTGHEDVWTSSRESRDQGWGEPHLVEAANSEFRETASAISPDGLVLWFASEREDENEGGMDVWQLRRDRRNSAWGDAVHVDELSGTTDDLPRSPAGNASILPLIIRSDETDYDIAFALRNSDGSYGTPELARGVNSDASESDPALSADGLTLIFASDRDDSAGDLYVATRRDLASAFGPARALDELNTDEEESDPWLSSDGSSLYFVSRRDGYAQIYEATR